MTPAEHYAEAERLLAEADKLPDQNSPAAARAYELLTATAQVHATLATINPDVLWPMRTSDGMEIRPTPDPACICPRHDHEPFARLATFPACPIHGGA